MGGVDVETKNLTGYIGNTTGNLDAKGCTTLDLYIDYIGGSYNVHDIDITSRVCIQITENYLLYCTDTALVEINFGGIQEDLIIANNSGLTEILQTANRYSISMAYPLRSLGGTLRIPSCPALTTVSFPLVESIAGNLTVSVNLNLKDVTGFPLLQTIKGPVNLDGAFSRYGQVQM